MIPFHPSHFKAYTPAGFLMRLVTRVGKIAALYAALDDIQQLDLLGTGR